MEKKTVLDHIRVYHTGEVEAHVHCFIADGDEIISGRHHYVLMEPGHDLSERLEAVNTSIVCDLKYPAVTDEQWKLAQAHFDLVATPEMVKKWDGIRAARTAAILKASAQVNDDA